MNAFLPLPPRRNRRFFSFHRPHLCRGCGAPLGSGAAGECRVPRTRETHHVRNQSSRACPSCLGISEASLELSLGTGGMLAMLFAKLDVCVAVHPKFCAAGPAAVGYWAAALAYSCGQELDGQHP